MDKKGALAASLVALVASAANADEGWTHAGKIGQIDMVVIDKDKEKDQDVYEMAIEAVCIDKNWCRVLFWSDTTLVPKKLPMTDAQVKGLTASWTYNGSTQLRKLLWACRIVNDPSQCFSE